MSALLAGMAILLLLAAPMDEARAQDAPTVTALTFESLPKSGDTYKRGEEIRMAVTFSEAVVVTGTPQMGLGMGPNGRLSVQRWADYNVALSQSSRLMFVYTVQETDRARNGLMTSGGLVLNGGTIKAMDDMTDADLKVSYSVTPGWLITRRDAVKVDGSQVDSSAAAAAPTALTASVVSTPATGDTYKQSEQIRVALDFDGAVVVKGTPRITLYLGTNGWANNNYRWADYDGALSTARRLVFSYTVQEADYTNALEIMTAHFNLNGGEIRASTDERDANIHRASSSGTGGKVDGFLGVSTPTVPAVSNVKIIAPENGDTFARNETISVGVKFSPSVRVTRGTGRPVLALSIGDAVREAYYVYTAAYGDLMFTYRVQAADRDLDGLSIAANALTLVGNRAIVHARSATTAADLSLGSSSVSNDARYKVDGSAVKPATVERIDLRSRPCGWPSVFELGCGMSVSVDFDQPIEVTGRPQLTLTIGTQTRRVDYSSTVSINGVTRSLRFHYLVQASDRDTDGVSIARDALSLNGGAIVVAGSKVPANLNLRHPNEIITPPVDGSRVTAPSLESLNVWPGSTGSTGKPAHDDTYRLGDEIRLTAYFSRHVG